MGFDRNLIQQYVYKIQALATKALEGQNVEAQIQTTIAEAIHHFEIVVGADKDDCVREFKRTLNKVAEAAHESQPVFEQAVRLAITHLSSV